MSPRRLLRHLALMAAVFLASPLGPRHVGRVIDPALFDCVKNRYCIGVDQAASPPQCVAVAATAMESWGQIRMSRSGGAGSMTRPAELVVQRRAIARPTRWLYWRLVRSRRRGGGYKDGRECSVSSESCCLWG